MFESILEFLTSNKAIIVGAALTISEVVVIVVNTIRQTKADAEEQVEAMADKPKKKSKVKRFLWAANPINVLRKPKKI